jgi:hypothetical protein
MASLAANSVPVEIQYKAIGGVTIYMDIYIPAAATAEKPAPCLVWWHGKILADFYQVDC